MKTYVQTILFSVLASAHHLSAAGFVGPEIRDQFLDEAAANGTFENFDGLSGSRFTTLGTLPGVTFGSNISTSGNPISGLPVVGSFTGIGPAGTIVGTPFLNGTDDGRIGYQILFGSPQRWVGLQRVWNEFTLTQFFNSNDELLFEFTGEANPFVGFIADSDSSTDWVARIQIDGRRTDDPAMTRQVGYTDDLAFGTSEFTIVPEPATSSILAAFLTLSALRRKRGA